MDGLMAVCKCMRHGARELTWAGGGTAGHKVLCVPLAPGLPTAQAVGLVLPNVLHEWSQTDAPEERGPSPQQASQPAGPSPPAPLHPPPRPPAPRAALLQPNLHPSGCPTTCSLSSSSLRAPPLRTGIPQSPSQCENGPGWASSSTNPPDTEGGQGPFWLPAFVLSLSAPRLGGGQWAHRLASTWRRLRWPWSAARRITDRCRAASTEVRRLRSKL